MQEIEMERELLRLRALNALLRATRDSVQPLEILAAVRDHIGGLVSFDRLGLLMAEPSERYCIVNELVTTEGLNCCPPGSLMPIAGTAIEWVFRELTVHVNHDLEHRQEFLEDPVLLADRIKSIARVPLFRSGRAFGLMTIKSVAPNHFSDADIGMLQEVGLQLSASIYISKLFLELKLQATTDALTGVFNRRALHAIHSKQGLLDFMDEMMIEHDWADISTVSLLLIDVDGMKLYNDTHGHEEGDRRLVSVTQILRYASPPQQLIFRFGGDEFVVLLPNVSELEAHDIAAHIRTAGYKNGDHRGEPIAISIGVKHDVWEDLPSILRQADAAMYANKRRNRAAQQESASGELF
jgi:diguanylate cyclase (GGDEF)-like protein